MSGGGVPAEIPRDLLETWIHHGPDHASKWDLRSVLTDALNAAAEPDDLARRLRIVESELEGVRISRRYMRRRLAKMKARKRHADLRSRENALALREARIAAAPFAERHTCLVCMAVQGAGHPHRDDCPVPPLLDALGLTA